MKGWEYQSLKDTKTLLFFFLEIRASKGEFAVERNTLVSCLRSNQSRNKHSDKNRWSLKRVSL